MEQSREIIPTLISSWRIIVRQILSFGWMLLLFCSLGWLWKGEQVATAQLEAASWHTKLDTWVWQTAQGGQTEFLVFLQDQADLSGAERLSSKDEKGWYVYRQLTAVAQRTQAPLLERLRRQGIAHRPYWVANMIWVRGDLNDALMLARRSDVAHLFANPAVRLDLPVQAESTVPQTENGIEWNLQKVNADKVWAMGYEGQGAVIGGQDTGYDWQHPALKNAYRGWDGSQANHDYNWHDAIHEPITLHSFPNRESTSPLPQGEGIGVRVNSPLPMGEGMGVSPYSPLPVGEGMGVRALNCPYNSPEPCDDSDHGTHTMGTMVGLDGNNQIGMAPKAKWIGCRNMEHGWGSPATYAECFQWFIAPTKIDGSDPNPAMAPDVINNSWSCPPKEGCTDPNVLKSVVEAVRAAGILTVQSAGNNGSECSTVSDPAAIYDASLTVGATDASDTIAHFSSRGPVTVDGSNRLKPDIVAPGVSVRSSLPTSLYGSKSGTSMAAPHVAGLAALILSARPYLKGQVDVLENLILSTALPRTTSQSCGGVPGSQIPNPTYGWGRIDAWQALQSVLTYPLYTTYFPFVGYSR
jgi:subtilisin family serine protease